MDLELDPSIQLPLLYEKHSVPQIDTELNDYCDVHDLIAVVAIQTQEVLVYRISGQLAYRIDRKDDHSRVAAVKWKPDGSLLGVGWSDGTCGIYSGEDGKLLSQIFSQRQPERPNESLQASNSFDDACETTKTGVCSIGWTDYHSKYNTDDRDLRYHGEDITTEDWYDAVERTVPNGSMLGSMPGSASEPASNVANLAKSICTFEATKPLPLITPLPSHVLRFRPEEQKFTSRPGIDTLLELNRSNLDQISTLVTCESSGCTSVYLNDSVRIGDFKLPATTHIFYASHHASATQVILSYDEHDKQRRLYHLELPLEVLSDSLQQVVAVNTKRMRNLVAYISLTIRCVQSDYASGLHLPSRLINNINEELAEKAEDDLVTNLYHLALTGAFSTTMLEWLTETVKENTHKRWDKAVNDMYRHIQTHIFVNVIPALDRLAIATNAIRGHALLHENTAGFVASAQFTALLDDIDSVRLIAQKLQLVLITEHRQFRAFSKWLRVMIDVGVAGPNSKAAMEVEEREVPNLDNTLVLAYIKETLNRSEMAAYLDEQPQTNGKPESKDSSETHENIVDVLGRLHNLTEENKAGLTASLNLPALTRRMIERAEIAILSITNWQSGMLSKPNTTDLQTELEVEPSADVLDFRMSISDQGRSDVENVIQLLMRSSGGQYNHQMHLYRILRLRTKECELTRFISTLPHGELLHAQIFQNHLCMVLFKHAEEQRYSLLSHDPSAPNEGSTEFQTLHSFPTGSGFVPSHFILGGRPGRMVCVAFESNGRAWKVFDLNGSQDRTVTMEDDNEMML